MSKDVQTNPDPEIVSFLEQCLAAAREGRVLVGVVSLGILGTDERPKDTLAGPAKLSLDVNAQAIFGHAAGHVHPESVAAAVEAVVNGAERSAMLLARALEGAGKPSLIVPS